jgi:hypothetical protein
MKKKKPDTEISLELLQDQFLENRDVSYLTLIYEELFPYARSLFLKFIKNKVYLPPEVVTDATKDICNLVIDKYYNKPSFKIESSFAGYIKFKILEVLYDPQKVWEEQCGSLNAILASSNGDSRGGSEVGELSEALSFDYLFPVDTANPEERFFKTDTSLLIDSIYKVIVDVFVAQNTCDFDVYQSTLTAMIVLLTFRKGTVAVDKYKQLWKASEFTDLLSDKALLEIYNRLRS